jgi:hypothetical protein
VVECCELKFSFSTIAFLPHSGLYFFCFFFFREERKRKRERVCDRTREKEREREEMLTSTPTIQRGLMAGETATRAELLARVQANLRAPGNNHSNNNKAG